MNITRKHCSPLCFKGKDIWIFCQIIVRKTIIRFRARGKNYFQIHTPTATILTKSRLITISEIKITLLDIKINYEEGSINIFWRLWTTDK